MSKTLSAKRKTTKKACERYQNLSKEEKEKEQQYGRERSKNLSKDENKSLLSIEKNILELEKSPYHKK